MRIQRRQRLVVVRPRDSDGRRAVFALDLVADLVEDDDVLAERLSALRNDRGAPTRLLRLAGGRVQVLRPGGLDRENAEQPMREGLAIAGPRLDDVRSF